MNPEGLKDAYELYDSMLSGKKKSQGAVKILCPPSPFVYPLTQRSGSKYFSFGGQNVFSERSGSHTGEVSASQLSEVRAEYVIVGHSERRKAGETNEEIAKKITACSREELVPILCVGEDTRDDTGSHLSYLAEQIQRSLAGVSQSTVEKIIIAYEPVWAIGSKQALDENDIHESVILIRKILSTLYNRRIAETMPILYGGSVTADNAKRESKRSACRKSIS